MARSYRLRTVDVFTTRQLAGNPLAVVLGADGLSTETMQSIAREMNLSETTFVLPAERGGTARVRIFTRAAELPFAGHPTIGTAWVLLDEGLLARDAKGLVLEEGVGPVAVRLEPTPDGLMLWMTTPPVIFGAVIDDRAAVAAALGLMERDLLADVPIQVATTGALYAYVALRDAKAVDRAVSSAERLSAVRAAGEPVPVYPFAPSGEHRLYGRMFAPTFGVHEDPATGSAVGPLAAFAVRYGLIAREPQIELTCEQGTRMGRQSFLHVKLSYADGGDLDLPQRIEVGGSVVPVLAATLAVEQ